MALIRDMMPAFELYQPASINDALALLDTQGKDAWVMAGGMDSLDWFKDRVMRPKAVVDLSQISALKGIRQQANGVEIGALTTLTEIVNHSLIQSQYGLLAMAARKVATPQIRNQGTPRIPAAGITAAACPVIVPAATLATPIRQPP
jgi:xanthine dehydrogenase YagS FAD-binding subunit